ncbi:hypothetical protein R6Q57_028948 [Mikania cordata]
MKKESWDFHKYVCLIDLVDLIRKFVKQMARPTCEVVQVSEPSNVSLMCPKPSIINYTIWSIMMEKTLSVHGCMKQQIL